MKENINFSPEPFQNHRLFLIAIWCVNVLLFIGVVFSCVQWMRLHQHNQQAHETISAIEAQQQAFGASIRKTKKDIDGIDGETYRKQIPQFSVIQAAFHSQWGNLLDDLGTLLGPNVRIVRLESEESLNSRWTTMTMRLDGISRYKDAELDFIRALQDHPAFHDVHFESEAYGQERNGAIGFQIRFNYSVKEV